MTDYTPGAIAPERADELDRVLLGRPRQPRGENAVTSMNVHAAARDVTTMRTYHDTFAVSRARTGKVTNQRHSGRCWMFAAFNVARAATMDLLDVDDFEFSQAFGFFYDKLEKFNVGLEYVIETAALPLDSREVSGLLEPLHGRRQLLPRRDEHHPQVGARAQGRHARERLHQGRRPDERPARAPLPQERDGAAPPRRGGAGTSQTCARPRRAWSPTATASSPCASASRR